MAAEGRAFVDRLDDGERMRDADRQLAGGHAGALQPQVEGEHRAVGICPGSSVSGFFGRLATSMPSSFMRRAACFGRRSKITCGVG